MSAQRPTWISPSAALMAVLVLSYGAVFSWLAVLRYETWHATVFDLGIFDQVIWNTARGHFFETSIYNGVPTTQLGEHFSPILAAFAPLYLIWNDVRLLLIVQSLYMAAGAVPVYLLASRVLEQRAGAILIAAAFLMYPNLAFVNLFDFHPDTVLVLLIPWAFYFLHSRSNLPFLATMGLTLMVKEDAALIVFAMGLFAFLVGRRRMGGALAVLGLCWFIVAINTVIPYFRGGHTYLHLSRFGYLGSSPGAIALNLVSHPLNTLQILFSAQNIDYLFKLLSPMGFFPILNPATAMVGVPVLLGNLITNYAPQHTIYYQYSIALGPVFFAASIGAVAHVSSRVNGFLPGGGRPIRLRRIRLGLAVVIFLSGVYGLVRDNPFGHFQREDAFSSRPNQAVLEKARELIPADASLAASNSLGARFAHRPELYMALKGPSGAQYVLVDLTDASMGKIEDVSKIAPPSEYRKLLEEEGIVLLQRQ